MTITDESDTTQRVSAALERLMNGTLGDDETERAEAVVVGRRMYRLLMAAYAELLVGFGADEGGDEDACDNRVVSADDTVAALEAAQASTGLRVEVGPGLVEGASTYAIHQIGGDGWFQEQIDAGMAPWDAVVAVAGEWLSEMSQERTPHAISNLALDLKAVAEHAASFLRGASLVKTAWAPESAAVG